MRTRTITKKTLLPPMNRLIMRTRPQRQKEGEEGGGNRGRATTHAKHVLADSNISVAPPRHSLRHVNPTPSQPTPIDNATSAPATQRRRATKPQANKTDNRRHPPNEDESHDTNAKEQNKDPEQAETNEDEKQNDEDKEPNDEDKEPNDEDKESNNDNQHTKQDNQQDNTKVNNEQDTNPNPNLDTKTTCQHAMHATANNITNTTAATRM
ncbi:uncharacterized protein LACBIDRAFT_328754 [Laccaria bicolor S238N-H82]|uniref:Predicted protein n=1 Tax=Laccaria bicolor (strain S238N-H82 / ATCC MYA-4686) TaxID=486041 RepID=B0DFW3_LACBS|nr:uncharacterized protein LACBIDRAFT_328754 [Laccaria bicolor S238N-H82]EDR06413.1 predicted protein [Laccaria bicolor S238N-H82]|eukprot:XP_001882785.1 predicted protein [Laccaria bicolor S238N-H82]